jgi:hypothetical protein
MFGHNPEFGDIMPGNKWHMNRPAWSITDHVSIWVGAFQSAVIASPLGRFLPLALAKGAVPVLAVKQLFKLS